ncbi:MAG TPA: hypothetical protein VM452_14060 [Caulifigura sp.]|jgi:hypothetical protein|nr:hypothetical protein [Caulifigura sp.]
MNGKLPPKKVRLKEEHYDEDQKRSLRRALPQATAFDDLFRGGTSVWAKIGGAAIATPLIMFFAIRRIERRGGQIPFEGGALVFILVLAAVLGAFIGASLSLKDIVESRKAKKKPVPFVLDLLYGKGIVSLLAFWVPFGIVCTLVVTALTLV